MTRELTSLGLLLLFGGSAAVAAVRDTQLPPTTVRDLIAVCAPAASDPQATGATNYCHGFAQGAVIVEMAHEQQRHARKLFCLPDPKPAAGSELARFIAWSNQAPARLDQPAIDGMFLYLAQQYPCSK
jgi:hypothetical protein